MQPLLTCISHIDEPNRAGCLRFYETYKDRIHKAPGSFIKHQAWEGGYIDHVEETMHIATVTYDALSTIRPLDFSLSDAYVSLFWHDVEKIFTYTEPKKTFTSGSQKIAFILELMKEYEINITDSIKNAILYVHGEGDMYSSFENIQKPLAAFVHCCDTISARVWSEYPKKNG